MSRRAGKPVPSSLPSPSPPVNEPSEEKKREKIDLGDTASLKKALDDAVIQVVHENGYAEDYFVSNVKIGLGLVTCLIAAIAQFYPAKFPDNVQVLIVCIALYFTATTALNFVSSYWEGEAFLFTKRKQANKVIPAYRIVSKLPRYSDLYTLIFCSADKPLDGEDVKLEKSITGYFDEDGFLAEEIFRKDAEKLLQQFEQHALKSK